MKKIEYIVILILFIFSLIYTDKITAIVKDKDPIMKSIIEAKKKYEKESINSTIVDDEIIPGISGCFINEDESYRNMKKINKYNDNLIVYENKLPDLTINNIYDKFIIGGNKSKREVSIVIYVYNSLNEIKSNVKLNIFLDSKLLENEIISVQDNYRIYNGGTAKKYNRVNIEWVNDIIEDNYNKSYYCINLNKNLDDLEICTKNKMHSIKPSIIVDKNTYNAKTNISNGSIIFIDEANLKYLDNIVSYLNSKGYDIVYLDELLNENIC